MDKEFDYATAFSRNIGWVTQQEQIVLKNKRIAIAGLGGVGGSHLLTLTRLGIGAFHIADFDTFELANLNRQVGANINNLGQPKIDVLAKMALSINPELEIQRFSKGIDEKNLTELLANVDLYIDSLDFFAIKTRRDIFAACAEMGIPAVTAAPLGMGVALLNFLPGKMTFEEYFRLEGLPEKEQLLKFLLGLAPRMLQHVYLVDRSTLDLSQHRGPSTPMACELCAGVAATQALKILLHRGHVRAAPYGLQFDAYRNQLAHTWRPGGNRNPLQQLGLHIARRQLNRLSQAEQPQDVLSAPQNTLEKILNAARWAPSGDNTQPWKFEIKNDQYFVVHGHDTRDTCVYDLQGHASQIAIGALLENIAIAATEHGLEASFQRRTDTPDTQPTYDVNLSDSQSIQSHPLAPYIPIRCTQRRAMSTRPLTAREKQALQSAIGQRFSLLWMEGATNRLRITRLLFKNAGLRLTLPEAYDVHRNVIEWNTQYSISKIPDKAVGASPTTLKLMQWALKSWQRVSFLNTYLGGTLAPRIEMDVIPGMLCACHFVLLGEKQPQIVDDYVAAGQALQRFWLTATQLGLNIQPEITPLVFHEYVRDNIEFSQHPVMRQRAQKISTQLVQLLGQEKTALAVFMGRIGSGISATSRSHRLPLKQLIKD